MSSVPGATPDPRRYLVVGPAWVGDMVMAQSLYRTLTESVPGTRVDVIAPAWSQPLLARMPEVTDAIDMPLGHGQFGWPMRRRVGRSLREGRYDQAIVLPRSFKSALAPFHARIPRRTGYRGEMRFGLLNDMRPLDKSVLTQTVTRYVALGHEPGATLPPPVPPPRLAVHADNQRACLEALGLATDRPVVAMMPGAEYGPAKCWPLEHFARVAAALDAAGCAVWILGSSKDAPAGEAIVRDSGSAAVNVCGRTRLEDAVDLLALATAAVTNDSGLMHVAAAVGTHVVAVYGSSTPAYTPPLTDNKTVFHLGLECSPCFERECPLGHLRCLREILPKNVARAALAPGPAGTTASASLVD